MHRSEPPPFKSDTDRNTTRISLLLRFELLLAERDLPDDGLEFGPRHAPLEPLDDVPVRLQVLLVGNELEGVQQRRRDGDVRERDPPVARQVGLALKVVVEDLQRAGEIGFRLVVAAR